MSEAKTDTSKSLVWVDLETTGLHPEQDKILEVAMLITDEKLNQIGDPYMAVIKPEGHLVMDLTVTAMHAHSFLLHSLQDGKDRHEVEDDLIRIIHGHGLNKPVLAGSTVGFDRSFLRNWMPEFTALLHYRNFDVSSLKILYRDVLGKELPLKDKAAHRALPDIMESLEAARFIAETIGTVRIENRAELRCTNASDEKEIRRLLNAFAKELGVSFSESLSLSNEALEDEVKNHLNTLKWNNEQLKERLDSATRVLKDVKKGGAA